MSEEFFLPSRSRSTSVIIGCLVGSLLLHGVAYGVLEEIDRPAVRRRTSEDIIRRQPDPRPRPHPVRLEEKKQPEPPRPEEPRPPPRRASVPKLAPRTPPPTASLAPPRLAPRPVLDLTMGAGVNENLTSEGGDFSVNTGDSALGDPTVAPMAPPLPRTAPPPAPEPPPPAPRRPPPPVYVKVLPEAVSVPQVAYPPAARRQQVEGTVTLEVNVGRDGKVLGVKVVKGIGYGLDEAAVRALQSARFKPAVGSDGRPMSYTIRYRYTFRIER